MRTWWNRTAWIGRELAASLALLALVVAPVGCLNVNPGDGGDLSKAAGLFIGTDQDGAIIAARNEAGDAFFVFGARAGNDIERVDSLLFRDRDGAESSIHFELGRPVQVQGPNGEFADIVYTEVTPTRLVGEVTLIDAGGQQVDAFEVVIDLEETVRDIADLVERVTGRDVTVVEFDDDGMTTKNLRQQVRITIFNPLYALVYGLGTVIASMIIVLGQILTNVAQLISDIAEALLLAVFTPFFAIAQLLGDTVVNVRLLTLDDIFAVPDPPVVVT